MMIYHEKDFKGAVIPSNYSIAYFMSSDFKNNKSSYISKNFIDKIKDTYMKNLWENSGYCLPVGLSDNGINKCCYGLIIKGKYYNKPTPLTVEQALCDLRENYIGFGLHHLVIFKDSNILNGINLDTFKNTVINIFLNDNIDIIVYNI